MFASVLAASLFAIGPNGPVKWAFAANYDTDGLVVVEVTAAMEEGWHIYATRLENELGPVPTSIRFEKNPALIPVGELGEPKPEEVFDPNFLMQVRYHSGSTVFMQRFKPAVNDVIVLKGEVEFMVCNDKTCLPPEVVTFSLDVFPSRERSIDP